MTNGTVDDELNSTVNVANAAAAHDECLDTIWMLLAAMLVFFMHAGFSLLETGCVQEKNAQNILAKNLLVVTCGFLCWYFCGWAVSVGSDEWMMDGFFDDPTLFRQWFFQGAFCATASTIVSGAIAERTQLLAFSIFILVMTSVIYPVVIFWGWSGEGFLNNSEGRSFLGRAAYMDFAGSGLVHMVGGVAAFCGACCVGPRDGRFEDVFQRPYFGPHSVPFCVIGTLFLWFGWYGFNAGSTLQLHEAGDANTAGLVAANTTLAPCCSGLVVFALRRFVVQPKALDVPGFCNGLLAGLVGITAGCAMVQSWEAMVIGLMAGVIYQVSSMYMLYLRVDDVVDAVAVHGACGMWGVLALGLFGDPAEGNGGNGVFYGGDQLGIQLMGILCIGVWTAACSLLVFVPMRCMGKLRLSSEIQEVGADAREHVPPRSYSRDMLMPPKQPPWRHTDGEEQGKVSDAEMEDLDGKPIAYPEHVKLVDDQSWGAGHEGAMAAIAADDSHKEEEPVCRAVRPVFEACAHPLRPCHLEFGKAHEDVPATPRTARSGTGAQPDKWCDVVPSKHAMAKAALDHNPAVSSSAEGEPAAVTIAMTSREDMPYNPPAASIYGHCFAGMPSCWSQVCSSSGANPTKFDAYRQGPRRDHDRTRAPTGRRPSRPLG
mmetsp:Transcript_64991/g.121020  ORF Transcript_64991/g.121020 Transcript_64991/m.121020 type:complete len:656 (-) Transcript_64991:141-2108(-)